MTTVFRLRLLGPVQVERAGEPLEGFKSRKALALLGYLATQDQPVERAYLTNLFWPDKPEERARNNLSQALHNLLSLWPDCIKSDWYTVEFQPGAEDWVDLKAFADLTSQGDPAALALAADLYQGDFMAGLYLDDCPEFEQWLRVEQENWRRQVNQVLCQLITWHTGRNELEQALEYANRLLAIDPCHEETHRRKMQLLAQSGQRSAALAQYESCCRLLQDELGVTPEADTVALYLFDEGSGTVLNDTSGYPGGPSQGQIRFGGNPPGPVWSTETPFGATPPVEVYITGPREVEIGSDATLQCVYSGIIGTPAFSWTRNGEEIPGAADDTLILLNVTTEDDGSYVVTLTTPDKAVYNSPPFVLSVVPQIPAGGWFALITLAMLLAMVAVRRRA